MKRGLGEFSAPAGSHYTGLCCGKRCGLFWRNVFRWRHIPPLPRRSRLFMTHWSASWRTPRGTMAPSYIKSTLNWSGSIGRYAKAMTASRTRSLVRWKKSAMRSPRHFSAGEISVKSLGFVCPMNPTPAHAPADALHLCWNLRAADFIISPETVRWRWCIRN